MPVSENATARKYPPGRARTKYLQKQITAGASLNDLAREFGISQQAMARYLERHDLETRGQQEAAMRAQRSANG